MLKIKNFKIPYGKFRKLSEQNPPKVLRSYLKKNKKRKLNLSIFFFYSLSKSFLALKADFALAVYETCYIVLKAL